MEGWPAQKRRMIKLAVSILQASSNYSSSMAVCVPGCPSVRLSLCLYPPPPSPPTPLCLSLLFSLCVRQEDNGGDKAFSVENHRSAASMLVVALRALVVLRHCHVSEAERTCLNWNTFGDPIRIWRQRDACSLRLRSPCGHVEVHARVHSARLKIKQEIPTTTTLFAGSIFQ